MHKFLMII